MKTSFKNIVNTFFPFFVIMLLMGYQADAQSSKKATGFHYDSLKVRSNYRYPNSLDSQYAYVNIVYPVFANRALDSLVKQAILSPLVIKHLFKSALLNSHPALSSLNPKRLPSADYHELADNYLQLFEEQAKEAKPQVYWYAEISVTVESNESGYVSLLCKKEYFSGGLHSLYDYGYLNYNPTSKQLLTLQSQFKPGTIAKLTKVAEAIFRKDEGLKANEPLDGYFFEDGKFTLTPNFTITNRGLKFLYVPYEIKPFAAGITALTIPFNNINNIVLPNSALAGKMVKSFHS